MPDPIRPNPTPSPPSARPDAVRVVSDRLLARTAARPGAPAASTVAPEGRSAPGVESPLPASLGSRDEAPSSHLHAIDPSGASEATPTGAAPGPAVQTVTAPAATGAVGVDALAVARPASSDELSDPPERPGARGAAEGPIARRPSVVSGRSLGDPTGLAPPESPEFVPGDGVLPLLSPTASITPRTPFALGPDPAEGPEGSGLGPSRDRSRSPADDLPRVRPRRPDALAGGIADLAPSRSATSPGGGDLAPGSVPTDEEVFAAATGAGSAGGPGSGSGPTGMDLARTNELLQQIVDAIRKQPSGSGSSLPSGGPGVYAERS